VQSMVPAEVSGVLFTADPIARDPRWMVISAVRGLGEALVQGEAEGETWRVDHETKTIEGEAKTLTRQQLVELAATARKIERLFGGPQDIEFAWADGKCFILQTRPITTPISNVSNAKDGERILWDNSNITESYSGVTTPLTYSVIRDAYAQVYRQFLSIMGARHVEEGVLRNLLGFYHGQVYYQLLNWYKALALLPAFEQNRRLMEQMMGVKQTAGAETKRRAGGGLALTVWIARMLYLHRTIDQRVQQFLDRFNAVLAEYRASDLRALSPHRLHAAYLDLNKRVLGQWQAPILTDFFAMIFFGLLRRLSERWLGPGGALHNDLLAGDGAIESLEPVRRIMDLAHKAREDPRLRAALSSDPAEALQLIRTEAGFGSFRAALDDYLIRYGDRCMNELKLEEPNLRDDPKRLIKLIAAAIEHPTDMLRAGTVRTKAEAGLARLPIGRRLLFTWILHHARRHIRNRENMRFARTRLFGLVRRLVNVVGEQWETAGVLEQAGDIYYLTIGEIWDFVDGATVTQNLRGLTALRRAEYGRHREDRSPDRFETFGVPYLNEPINFLAQAQTDADVLRGVGCCSGEIRGRARVIRSVDDVTDLNGDILVAERADPGWVFLFPSASGILVERGSPLSHSAIVAREMGKPTIVNIPGLTARVHTGDHVEMDGEKGIVKVTKL
ncbi:MAG: PEP-utilizing enzyme, partial [Gammaproteobacteria bacterium]